MDSSILKEDLDKTTLRAVDAVVGTIFFARVEYSLGIALHIYDMNISVADIGIHLLASHLVKLGIALLLNGNSIAYAVQVVKLVVLEVNDNRVGRYLVRGIPTDRVTT